MKPRGHLLFEIFALVTFMVVSPVLHPFELRAEESSISPDDYLLDERFRDPKQADQVAAFSKSEWQSDEKFFRDLGADAKIPAPMPQSCDPTLWQKSFLTGLGGKKADPATVGYLRGLNAFFWSIGHLSNLYPNGTVVSEKFLTPILNSIAGSKGDVACSDPAFKDDAITCCRNAYKAGHDLLLAEMIKKGTSEVCNANFAYGLRTAAKVCGEALCRAASVDCQEDLKNIENIRSNGIRGECLLMGVEQFAPICEDELKSKSTTIVNRYSAVVTDATSKVFSSALSAFGFGGSQSGGANSGK